MFVGGSDTRPTWKKSIVKTMGKKTEGEAVQRERIVVKMTVTARSGQRRSLMQEEESPETNVKDLGNGASKGIDWMPLPFVDVKLE